MKARSWDQRMPYRLVSAGWMQRLVVESKTGLRLEADRLYVTPCLPAHWHGVTISYRHRETVHHLAIVPTAAGEDQRGGVMLDGVEFDGQAIPLVDHRQAHAVAVRVRVNATADVRDVPAAEPQLA
jgi:cyclic beta-1,2-glucan synthetase